MIEKVNMREKAEGLKRQKGAKEAEKVEGAKEDEEATGEEMSKIISYFYEIYFDEIRRLMRLNGQKGERSGKKKP